VSRVNWSSPEYQAAWREASALTPVLDAPEDRTGYEHPVRDAVLGWLVLLLILGGPIGIGFLLSWGHR